MSRETVRTPRSRLIVIFMGACMFFGFMSAFLVDAPTVEVPPALAATACSTPNPTCSPPDDTKTSVIEVTHYMVSPGRNPVEPDDGEVWDIVAIWNTGTGAGCQERSETASVEVSWTGTEWELSNETLTTNIVDIELCPPLTCQSGETVHGYGYMMIVDITDPVLVTPNEYNLRRVNYELDTVDDGSELYLVTCSLGGSVTFADTIDGATDWGPYVGRCPFICELTGATCKIEYE